MSKKVVLFGSSFFSKIVLSLLFEQASHYDIQISGIVTKPDTLYGRNRQKIQNAVKSEGIEKGIPVKPDDQDVREFLRELSPDTCLVAAYGKILKEEVLALAPKGFINIHGSILPSLRGAIPIQMAIYQGLESTGVTITKMDAGMDTGQIITREGLRIAKEETFFSLGEKMASLGVNLFLNTLDPYFTGKLIPFDQELEGVSYCYLKQLDTMKTAYLTDSAFAIERAVRALAPFDFLQIPLGKIELQLVQVKVVQMGEITIPQHAPKLFVVKEAGRRRAFYQCADGLLELLMVKPTGKAQMSGESFLNGYSNKI